MDRSTPTRQPPIPLPNVPGVQFLSNVGDVLSEGNRMQHCIGGYAGRAVLGHCFLFHVDHAGESASVEIDQTGRIRQACGPKNQSNQATKYATRVLATWAGGFPNAGRRYVDSFI
nr:PcfJ domain-containing protein [Rhodopirellula sp. JC639]